MNITITAKPQFRFQVTEGLVSVLMKMAENHYDHTCNMMAVPGGKLYGWMNAARYNEGWIQCEFRTLDLVLKVCENTTGLSKGHVKDISEFTAIVRRALSESNPIQWCDIVVD